MPGGVKDVWRQRWRPTRLPNRSGPHVRRETMPRLCRLMEGDPNRIEARNISEWIETEDEGLGRVLDDIIEQLARVAVNTITLLAPRQGHYLWRDVQPFAGGRAFPAFLQSL